jgi:xylulokinase
MADRMIVVGLDIGTSGVRAVAYTTDGVTVAEGRAKMAISYPTADWAEQCPTDWWQGTVTALLQLSRELGAETARVVGIGLTGQCPTFALMSPNGEVSTPGLLYQDNRAVEETDLLIRKFGAQTIHSRTGQWPSPFYIAPKLLWLQHKGLLHDGDTVVQPRDYVGWRLTGVLATDPTHAACTLLYDLQAARWAKDWIAELELNRLVWPEILPSCSLLGCVSIAAAQAIGFPAGVPVSVGGADSICAIYGAIGLREEYVCDVSGTSTCLHLTVKSPVISSAVNTYPHIVNGLWCAETGLNTTGIAVRWLSDILGMNFGSLFDAASDIPSGTDGLMFLPHLSGGERDNPGRRGAFIGLHLGHHRGHFIRAVLEGISFALRYRLEMMGDAGCSISGIVTCGGGATNLLWNQIKANILGLPLTAVNPPDTTAYGAALTAAHALGVLMLPACEQASAAFSKTVYIPGEEAGSYADIYNRFCRLEEALIGL